MDLIHCLGRTLHSEHHRDMLGKSENRITYFAQTNFRNEQKAVRHTSEPTDEAHMYVIGKTGIAESRRF